MRPQTVSAGPLEATFLPDAGARLHRLRAFGHDLLRTPDDADRHRDDPFFWGAYVLAPWGNRLDATPTAVGDRAVDLPPNFPDGSAIHGQVYARAWDRDGDRFTIRGGGDGWPWRYSVSCRPVPDEARLRLEYDVINEDDAPMPAGLGLHPWWRQPVEVAIRGASAYPTTTDSPAAPGAVAGELDRRRASAMPAGLDAAWTALGDPPVVLVWPDSGVRLTMRAEGGDPHVVAASPPNLDAVAVELQSHAPQGLRRLLRGEPGAMAMIDPGQALRFVVELGVEQA